jgi:hypothetical protein
MLYCPVKYVFAESTYMRLATIMSESAPSTDHPENPQAEQQTTQLGQILSLDFTFSKRHVGIILFTVGVLALIGLLLLDSLGMGRDAEIGPTQQIGFALAGFITLAGASLIPMGNKPF